MNLGLGNLNDLKTFILPESIRAQTDKNAVLQSIGKGVSGLMERMCNRWFARTVGAQDVFSADRDGWTLSRFPVESITSVEVKTTDAEGWVAQTGLIDVSHLERGLILFSGLPADPRSLVRITYTGGYFFETLEPTDGGYPTATPSGSTAVPDSLKLAWLSQCQAVFEGKDHLLPKGISRETGDTVPLNLGDIKLLPSVADTLRHFTRYQLT